MSAKIMVGRRCEKKSETVTTKRNINIKNNNERLAFSVLNRSHKSFDIISR